MLPPSLGTHRAEPPALDAHFEETGEEDDFGEQTLRNITELGGAEEQCDGPTGKEAEQTPAEGGE